MKQNWKIEENEINGGSYRIFCKKNINKSISLSMIKDGKTYSIKAVIIDVKDDYVEIKREGFDNEFVPIAEIVHAKLIIKLS